MRLRPADRVAAILVAALVSTYAVLLVNGSVGFIGDPRAMASIGLLSALVLCPLSGLRSFDLWAGGICLLGAAALGLGVATLMTNDWSVLATFVGCIVAIWALATLQHALKDVRRVSIPSALSAPAGR
jgi:hypothetical protein